jgi:hypoxia up-regulated 1
MKVGLVKPGVPMEIVLNRESLRKTVTMLAISNQNERAFAESAFAVVCLSSSFISQLYIFIYSR